MTLFTTNAGGGFPVGSTERRFWPARAALHGGADWRPGFERAHRIVSTTLLAGLVTLGLLFPSWPSASFSGGLLLVGGALIGMPHGSSDFVVAFRCLRPRFHAWWLPVFLAAYLSVTAAVLLGWRFAPGTTMVAFLAVSGLHFGESHDGTTEGSWLRTLARATTPILPIFLLHAGEVAGIIGAMCGRPETVVMALLDGLRPAGLALYGALLTWTVWSALAAPRPGDGSARVQEAAELVLLAVAAWLLPPLLVFTVYFCLLHAVRHMVQLGHEVFPRNGAAAMGMAATIVVPSAVAFGVALGFAWNAMGGALPTQQVIGFGLQLTAALTIPHVLLEWAAGWSRPGAGPGL